MLGILVICISSRFGGNQLHMYNPVFCKFSTQEVGHSTNFNYKYPHCLVMWVGSNHLLLFQVSVDMFVLGCRVWTAKICPHSFGSGQIPAQNSQTTSRHIRALFILPFIPTQWTCSIDHSINLEFTNLALYLSTTLNEVRIVDQESTPQVFPNHPFSHQLSSSNPFSLPDVMTFHSKMLWRDSWRSDLITSISTGGVFVHTNTPMFGHSLIQISFRRVFHPHCFFWQWERAGVEFHTPNGEKMSEETTTMAILITSVVGERDLGLVMVFCHPNQAKMEAYDALFAVHQYNSSKPSVVMVRRYSNTPCSPWGMIHSLYLDVGTFFGGITSMQFPLDRLHFGQLLPISRTNVPLPHKVGKECLETYPLSQSSYGMVQRRNTIFPIPSPCQFHHWLLLHYWEETLRLREDQTVILLVPKWRGSGYHPSLKLLQDNTQARA